MNNRIELKVGDRVRLLGGRWETERGIPFGTTVTIGRMTAFGPWSDDHSVGIVAMWDGSPYRGFPIRRVEDIAVEDSNEQAAADVRAVMNVRIKFREALKANWVMQAVMQVPLADVEVLLRIADEYQALKRSLVDGDGR